jgi:hypothetical protein
LQAVEVEARDVHVSRRRRHFQQLKDADASPDLTGTDPARLAGAVNLFKPLVPEADDHRFIVNYLVYAVQKAANC